MGLDMYLTAKRFFWYNEKEIQKKLQDIMNVDDYEVDYIELQVGYWRKANQIHKWFVDNIQNGVDDCGKHQVEKEKLIDLLNIVNQALETNKPEKILPTQSGFFFGSTEYDEYYKKDLEDTKKMIEKYLEFKDNDKYDLYYQSSW